MSTSLEGKDLIFICSSETEQSELVKECISIADEKLNNSSFVILHGDFEALKELNLFGAMRINLFALTSNDSVAIKAFIKSDPIWIEAQKSDILRRFTIKSLVEFETRLKMVTSYTDLDIEIMEGRILLSELKSIPISKESRN